jgi:uncharacterized cupredoxin-like copper-binding protein
MNGRRRWYWILLVAWLVLCTTTAATALATGSDDPADGVLGPGEVTVTLDVDHSRFTPDRIEVRPHTTVTFVVVNRDPIGHELIVGDDEVHDRHESGTHDRHGAVPGEVSVPPHDSARTRYTFHEPGTVLFACHLPGHFAYGMVGEVVVTPEE